MKKFFAISFFALAFAISLSAAKFSEAEEFYRAGDTDNAILRATGVVLEAESRRDTTSLIKAWSLLGMCYAERGDVLQVAKYTNLLIDAVGKSTDDFNYVTSSLNAAARIYHRSGRYEEAIKYLELSMVYETQLNRPSILAQRYNDLAQVYSDMGDWSKALQVTNTAIDYYTEHRNLYIIGNLYYMKGVCEENLGDKASALNSFRKSRYFSCKHFKGDDRKVPADCYLKLAGYALQENKSDSAYFFYCCALASARTLDNHGDELESLLALKDLEHDPIKKEEYSRLADSLSFAPYVSEFVEKSSASLIDFPRKELEQKVTLQTSIVIALAVSIVLIILLIASLTYNVRHFKEKAKIEASKNAALAESNRQKDRLLALASAAVEEKERYEIKKLAKDLGNPAEIKLTKREREVAKYASEGFQNKEIAEKLGINTRTVEAHRNSLYRKLGINNAIELSNYMNRIKYMSDNES
ncbi:MAG: LuxR C-terminal-related transcriptional regulator [Bacteroidales bacterium]|nr:LuxR C-terminal-related transcriptional regulator [Bacteroidales bacterium]